MKAEYRRLGDYIRQVDVRNKEQKVSRLVGLTIDKAFIPSVANTIGTDISNYKIIRKKQFACSLMQVSRDGKMPVAMFEEEEAIMSPAYPMFEVYSSDLLPDYLMLWFLRPEFDREASFYAVGGVRGSLEWNDFCDMMLPVPPIEEQRRIVEQYQTVERRIKNNERLIALLEDTAQTIFRHRFVDNIDPNNLPEGWRMGNIFDVIELYDSQRVPLSGEVREKMKKIYPYYGATCMMDYVDDYHYDGIYLLMGEDGSVMKDNGTPYLQYVYGKFWVNNHAHVMQGKNGFTTELVYTMLSSYNIQNLVTGAVQAKLSQTNMALIKTCIPPDEFLSKICQQVSVIFSYIRTLRDENSHLLSYLNLYLQTL
ncbi:MAG: restriction endonuclease subunit S [Prevotella sp.]|nr:restriction endonuclease subunit S [Prevotella sp.]